MFSMLADKHRPDTGLNRYVSFCARRSGSVPQKQTKAAPEAYSTRGTATSSILISLKVLASVPVFDFQNKTPLTVLSL